MGFNLEINKKYHVQPLIQEIPDYVLQVQKTYDIFKIISPQILSKIIDYFTFALFLVVLE